MLEPTNGPADESDNTSCFVIGPIGDRLGPYGSDARAQYEQSLRLWDYVIRPACQVLGIKPVRADQIAEPGEITEQIFRRLRDADLVIADVTGGNANVMYELGFRHTFNKPTIQIGEKERLPFDITVIRTLQFVTNETGLVEARDKLRDSIKAALAAGSTPVTATRIWHEHRQGNVNPPATDTHEVVHAEDDVEGPGFLDMLAEAEEALPLLNDVATELSAVFEQLGPLADSMVIKMEEADRRGQGAKGRLAMASELAAELEDPTSRIEQLAAEFTDQLERIDPGISHLIGVLEEEPSLLTSEEGAREFNDSIRELADAASEGLGQISLLADAVKQMGQISNRLRPVTRRMFTALRRISDSARTMNAWGDRIRSVEASITDQ